MRAQPSRPRSPRSRIELPVGRQEILRWRRQGRRSGAVIGGGGRSTTTCARPLGDGHAWRRVSTNAGAKPGTLVLTSPSASGDGVRRARRRSRRTASAFFRRGARGRGLDEATRDGGSKRSHAGAMDLRHPCRDGHHRLRTARARFEMMQASGATAGSSGRHPLLSGAASRGRGIAPTDQLTSEPDPHRRGPRRLGRGFAPLRCADIGGLLARFRRWGGRRAEACGQGCDGGRIVGVVQRGRSRCGWSSPRNGLRGSQTVARRPDEKRTRVGGGGVDGSGRGSDADAGFLESRTSRARWRGPGRFSGKPAYGMSRVMVPPERAAEAKALLAKREGAAPLSSDADPESE